MNNDRQDIFLPSLSTIDPVDDEFKNTDIESSLESYSQIFDKNKHNFTASSEISYGNLKNDEININLNRTFTKEKPVTRINAFTGKPISPNPWRKLSTKNTIQHETQAEVVHPVECLLKNFDTCQQDYNFTALQGQSSEIMQTRQSRRDMISSRQEDDSSSDDNHVFEQFPEEHQIFKQTEDDDEHIPIRFRRRKKKCLQNVISSSSSSSLSSRDSRNDDLIDINPKVDQFVHNDPSWRKLVDVYTSEESDENHHLLLANSNLTVRLKSEIYTSDHSSSSTSSKSSTKPICKRISVDKLDQEISITFLESLSEHVPFEDKHADAKPYFIQSAFKQKEKRQELADKLLVMFNRDVFSEQLLGKISVTWSSRLTATAGHCTTRRTTCTAIITLSHKVCDSPERCRDTLLHEMCHAAVTLIDGVLEHGHGPRWHQWKRIAEQCYPYLPRISIKHTYDVAYKYVYRCIQCQHEVYRHSKSLSLDVDSCGKCMGQFELIVNYNQNENSRKKTTPNKYNLFVQENFQTMKHANPHLSTPQLMKQLSAEYKKKNQQQIVDLPDLDQLQI